MVAFDANKYNSDYKRENYEQIVVKVYKGRRAEIQNEAAKRKISTTQLILNALENQYGLDLSKPSADQPDEV